MSFPISNFFAFRNPELLSLLENDSTSSSLIKYEIYEEIGRGLSPINLDLLSSMIKKYWLDTQGRADEDKCFSILKAIAHYFFEFGNSRVYVSERIKNLEMPWNQLHELGSIKKKECWSHLCKSTNLDMLFAIFLNDLGVSELNQFKLWDDFPLATEPGLQKILEKGMSETHLHMGASSSFLYLWTVIMSKPPDNRAADQNPSFFRTYEGTISFVSFFNYLLSARIIRHLLAKFLFSPDETLQFQMDAIFSDPEYQSMAKNFQGRLRETNIVDLFIKGEALHRAEVANFSDLQKIDQWVLLKLGLVSLKEIFPNPA
ncbi:MAG: hypothetical protein A2156_13390 [Deltaproteobacteria bacterium RBG_16_48_10]|nr:MAG: hypothetical protein A2156_13390 [Deltaproteobacteria bacterium RBG_16_48_10]